MNNHTELYVKIQNNFTPEELDVILLDMGISPGNVPGRTSIDHLRIRNTVDTVIRHGLLSEFMQKVRECRPKVNWVFYGDKTPQEELSELLYELLEFTEKQENDALVDVGQKALELGEQLASEKPDRKRMVITAEGLKRAAENVAEVMPVVLNIAIQILQAVGRM